MRKSSSWTDLETPVALLDAPRLQANVERMQARIGAHGAALRPHVKTAKCVEVARLHQRAGARGITVSTLKEAEVFFDAGFDDVLYAVGIAPAKLAHAQALRERGCRLKIVVDSVEAAQAVVATGHPFEVLIEVDTDGERAGVGPESDLLIAVGRTLHAGGAVLAGVMTHAGGSYHQHGAQALADFAERERALTVRAAERLRAAGLPCPVVSVGSTPTALSARRLDGVTEVRAGVYVFHDLVMAGLGVCRLDEVALSVGASVIGHQAHKGWTLIDAGWMALSRDRGTAEQAVDQGYGLVCAEDGTPLPDHIVALTNQEHGIVTRRDGAAEPDVRSRFPLGSRLRILPNHACATAAQFDRYHVIGAGDALQTWPRFGGW